MKCANNAPGVEQEDIDRPALRALLQEMLQGMEECDPQAIEPHIEKLKRSISDHHVERIEQQIARFDFGRAKEEILKLLEGLEMEKEA